MMVISAAVMMISGEDVDCCCWCVMKKCRCGGEMIMTGVDDHD